MSPPDVLKVGATARVAAILEALDKAARESGPETFDHDEGACLCFNLIWRAAALFVEDERLRRLTAEGMVRALSEISDDERLQASKSRGRKAPGGRRAH